MVLTLGAIGICTAASFAAGLVDSISGGGGLIIMPTLLLSGVPPHVTMGTSKFASSLGTTTALINYARRGYVLWRIVPVGIAFSLFGAWCGSLLALRLDSAVLGKIMVFMLPLGMLLTLMPKNAQKTTPAALSPGRFRVCAALSSFAVGAYDGFFGPGAGSFFILAFHRILRMGLIEASAAAKVLNLASNIGALVAFIWAGKVLFALALPMAAASMCGNWVGSRLAMRLGASLVRRFLVLSMGLLLLSLLWRYFIAG